jgi:hypothetical protein
MTRLPMPDPIPTRADETWRVERDRVLIPTDEPFRCGVVRESWKPDQCIIRAVAVARNSRGEVTIGLCAKHLVDFGCWIENGWVVAWTLHP